MSVGQLTGTFASNNNKYDDGEANYKLPVFNKTSIYISGVAFWVRNIWWYNSNTGWNAWSIGGDPYYQITRGDFRIRPLIYIR